MRKLKQGLLIACVRLAVAGGLLFGAATVLDVAPPLQAQEGCEVVWECEECRCNLRDPPYICECTNCTFECGLN